MWPQSKKVHRHSITAARVTSAPFRDRAPRDSGAGEDREKGTIREPGERIPAPLSAEISGGRELTASGEGMSAKPPVPLKWGSHRGKKKPREALSSEMISPPLGDFRHTIHIGSRGADDVFGDLSFLEGKLHLLPGRLSDLRPRPPPSSSAELGRTASLREGDHLPLSPLLQNAVSLPALGGPRAPPKPPRLHLDSKDSESREKEPAGRAETSGENRISKKVPAARAEALLPHAVSLLSLQLDLGPSILDDILEVMEQKKDLPPEVADLVQEPGSRCEILSSE
ncbi:cdc42 effector protein 2-like isoform X2 [Mobula birostris]|uniref:cdc42 effector protein 2-like isoform X2 n=1 Tax=Mobula birostris TaxID=1983395 RepID=UPI003B2877CA